MNELPPPDDEALEAMLVDYVLGNLDPARARAIEDLARNNPEVEAEVAKLRNLRDLLPYAVAVEPPAHLEQKVLLAMEAGAPRPVWWRRSPALIALVAAAVLVVALGIDSWRLRSQLGSTGDLVRLLQQPNTRLFSLRGTGAAAGASGSIVMDLDRREAVVAIQNLPITQGSQRYHLWVVADGESLACGRFVTDRQGSVVTRLEVPPGLYSSVVSGLTVTLEPGSAAKPTRAPTMITVL